VNETETSQPRELKVGGPVDSAEQLYVSRDADQEFLDLLKAGEFVNVVTSRQMGKTSLVYHAMARLAPQGYQFAYYDLSKLRSETDSRRYFQTLVGEIARELNSVIDLDAFWAQRGNQTVSQGFIDFFRHALANSTGQVIVVLDEIDSTLEQDFTDDLFTAIRSIYTARPREAVFKRLTFCLVGVATPNELVKSRRTTPYNIGRTIWLRDFEPGRDNLAPLARTLNADESVANQLFERVLHWTGGQPYLTAWMCDELRREGAREQQAVNALVERSLSSLDRLRSDPHFEQTQRFISERVSNGAEVLGLYERVLRGDRETDQAANLAYAQLKLSGLVKRDENGFLVTRNRIYERLFNLEWVQKSRPKQEIRRARRFAYAAAAALVVALIGGGVYYQTSVVPLQRREAARSELQRMQVTLIDDPRGWTEVRLPAQGGREVLQRALPHLETLSSGSDAQELSLDFSGVEGVNLDALAPLTGLRKLNLSRTRGAAGLVPLRRLTGLRQLILMETGITTLGPLAALANLEELDISRTSIDDLKPLAKLSNLKRLSAAMTLVADLAPLRGLGNLEALDVSFTKVRDLSPIAALEKLQQLNLADTGVTDLVPLGRLTTLRELNLSRTKVRKDRLSQLVALTALRTLALDGTGVRDFNVDGRIAGLKVLQDSAPRKPSTAYRASESFRDCPECPQMVVVPAGSFVMGSPGNEAGRYDDEGPQRTVTIGRDFAVGKFEVRFDEWMQCVLDEECRMVSDESWGRGPRPVVNVSWNDAKRYTEWLAKKTGKSYRLLTEAEWEYAARADTKTPRYWDAVSTDPCLYANVLNPEVKKKYKFEWDSFSCEDGYTEAAPVGAFRPNAFGLYDTLGNVWEWVEDCWHDSYKDAPTDGSAWVTKDCTSRVVRGGGWDGRPQVVRSAVRFRDTPEFRNDNLGFRVARTLTP
jgi:formylglycine-generating enzyme required for sulfatase activity